MTTAKKLIVCTTAICRPEIHNLCISTISKKLELLNDYNIYWIINIDNYSANGTTQEQTKNNLDTIISNKIKTFYILSDKSSHPGAINNIINIIKFNDLMCNDYIYLWLEDDWFVDKNFEFDSVLKYIFPKTWLGLTMKFMGLNPSLFGGELFLDAFGSEFDLTCDAENQAVANMRKKFLKNNGLNMITLMTKDARSHKNYNMKIINKITRIDSTKYKLIRNNIVILLDKYNRPINVENDQLYNDIKSNYTVIIWAPVVFTDAGRDWIKTTNLIKWNKGDNQIKTYSLKNG